MSNFLCTDCGMDTDQLDEYYMVHDSLWAVVGAGKGMLCVGCLEKRAGRHLTPRDFTDAPLNQWFFPKSSRLRSRVEGTEVTR